MRQKCVLRPLPRLHRRGKFELLLALSGHREDPIRRRNEA